MIKNILLDLDGTIINSEDGITKTLVHTLMTIGQERPSMEEMRKCIGPPLTQSFLNVFHVPADQLDQTIKIFRKRYHAKGMYECCLYDGIEEMIRQLKEDGYQVAVASSKVQTACYAILENFKVDHLFDDIVGSSPDASIETKEQVLQEVFRRNPSWKKAETILVGDTCFDAIGAEAAGIKCLGVSYGFGTKEELLEANAIAVVDTPEEVRAFIETI